MQLSIHFQIKLKRTDSLDLGPNNIGVYTTGALIVTLCGTHLIVKFYLKKGEILTRWIFQNFIEEIF